MTDNQKLPISVMIVGLNEGRFLDQCFQSVDFCDEIIYTDLGSNDNSLEIASKYTDKIYRRAKVPSCEYIQSEVVNYTKNDWVIFIDPDEKVDQTLAKQIDDNFIKLTQSSDIGAVTVPWIFYFKKRKLRGTVWGGVNYKYHLIHKKRFEFSPIVHYGRKLQEGFKNEKFSINETGTNILHHYWMSGFRIFFAKHFRYLQREGRDNYNIGKRVSKKTLLFTPFSEFRNCFVSKEGYKDGFLGFFLSVFWAYYKTFIAFDIFHIQRKGLSFYEKKSASKNLGT